MNADTIILWLLAIPLISSPIIYLVGRINIRRAAGDLRMEKNATAPSRWLALAVLGTTWIPLINAGLVVSRNGHLRGFVGGIPINFDGISLLLAGTALTLGLLVAIFSMPYMAGEVGEEKYYALLPLMVGTMIGLGCANDLFNLWVWFEAMAVSSYLLVAFYARERGALEAGVKYLVQSAVGSVFVLVAIAIIFSQARTLRLDAIAASYAQINGLTAPLNSIILAAG
ncbi:MAG: hypothetical protein EHM21_16255, partial [Chloroflexi bacterium]